MMDLFEEDEKEEIRPRISLETGEKIVEDEEKSFEENLIEKLGLDE